MALPICNSLQLHYKESATERRDKCTDGFHQHRRGLGASTSTAKGREGEPTNEEEALEQTA